MSKASRTRRKRAKARKARTGGQRKPPKRTIRAKLKAVWYAISLTWKIVTVALIVIGAVSQIYFFRWQVSVTPGDTFKDSDPFATMFIMQNDGEFPIYDLEFVCVVNSTKGKGVEYRELDTSNLDFNVPLLAAHARTSAPCYIPFVVQPAPVITSVDVTLSVSYRPKFFTTRKTNSYHYIGTRKDDGSYAWIPMAKK